MQSRKTNRISALLGGTDQGFTIAGLKRLELPETLVLGQHRANLDQGFLKVVGALRLLGEALSQVLAGHIGDAAGRLPDGILDAAGDRSEKAHRFLQGRAFFGQRVHVGASIAAPPDAYPSGPGCRYRRYHRPSVFRPPIAAA
jgi:hypothetical protein